MTDRRPLSRHGRPRGRNRRLLLGRPRPLQTCVRVCVCVVCVSHTGPGTHRHSQTCTHIQKRQRQLTFVIRVAVIGHVLLVVVVVTLSARAEQHQQVGQECEKFGQSQFGVTKGLADRSGVDGCSRARTAAHVRRQCFLRKHNNKASAFFVFWLFILVLMGNGNQTLTESWRRLTVESSLK